MLKPYDIFYDYGVKVKVNINSLLVSMCELLCSKYSLFSTYFYKADHYKVEL